MTEERLAELMVKTVDGVASPSEKEELMSHIAHDPLLYREYETQAALKAITDGWVQRLTIDAAEDAYEAHPLSKVERGVGVTFFLIGLGILWGGGMYTVLMDPEAPLFVRVGYPMMGAGLLIILGSVLRWKRSTSKSDKYTEVIR